jgi:predicted glycogen debranching enzyme
MTRVDRAVCSDLDRATSLEWLETNGLGGFASSTVIGLNTRRYHGLLVAATKPPVGRMVLLSKVEETLVIKGQRYDLSANQYPGAVHPQGFRYLKEFRLDPWPVFVYEIDGVQLEKTVFLVHDENTSVIEYHLCSTNGHTPSGCSLELRPLLACRDYHSTMHRNDAWNRMVHSAPGVVSVAPWPDAPAVCFSHDASSLTETGDWYYNFEYTAERERGLDWTEDLYSPLVLNYYLDSAPDAVLIASTQPCDPSDAAGLRRREIARRKSLMRRAPVTNAFVQRLTAAADQYIVKRGSLHTIIAGYHWFADWGRDTMIALPGLTLATGRPDIAADILQAFAASTDRGMLPNRFPDACETPEYNTVDATLWFFEAVRGWVKHTDDHAFVQRNLYPRMKNIIGWHRRGTRYGIHVDRDGLLTCGEPGVQLTWMDAKVGDWVVTPRTGKPVEIQALWYNALRVMGELAHRFEDSEMEATASALATQAAQSFEQRFWNNEAGCLFDVDGESTNDAAIRPNQIFAVSLCHSMLPLDKQKQVVDVVRRELLTPLGLRSLGPCDPSYRAVYEGGVAERDSAYHQGTVWPWLMGPFLTAWMKVKDRSAAARAQAVEWLHAFESHLDTACLGHISEIADAGSPHRPKGCVAQAWSVAELLRAAVENVYAA